MDTSRGRADPPVETQDAVLKVVLAEVHLPTVQSVLGETKRHRQWVAMPCTSFEEIVDTLDSEIVDLLILGSLADRNYLDAFRNCRKRWPNLPVILLTNQPFHPSFRDWARKKGFVDVVNSSPKSLSFLPEVISNIRLQAVWGREEDTAEDTSGFSLEPSFSSFDSFDPPTVVLTLAGALAAIAEITEQSSTYFGPMVIANYWKKAQTSAIAEYPWLQFWNVDRFGKISCPEPDAELTPEQLQSLQRWIEGFLAECRRVIVDFPELLKQKAFSPEVKEFAPSIR